MAIYGAVIEQVCAALNGEALDLNLQDANLNVANLQGAYLNRANLKGANLEGAYLGGANLNVANLQGAYLGGANLNVANLQGANLEGAKLEGANLEGAKLEGANLKGAYLKGAYLEGANLEGANLEGANLEGANGFRFAGAPDPAALRTMLANIIELRPELHDQSQWGDGSADPSCATACCVAGWACHLGGGARGCPVPSAAVRLLWIDGKPMPNFGADASRKSILEALRA